MTMDRKRATEVNIAIMRAFIKMRELRESNEQLNRKSAAIIRKLSEHALSLSTSGPGK